MTKKPKILRNENPAIDDTRELRVHVENKTERKLNVKVSRDDGLMHVTLNVIITENLE